MCESGQGAHLIQRYNKNMFSRTVVYTLFLYFIASETTKIFQSRDTGYWNKHVPQMSDVDGQRVLGDLIRLLADAYYEKLHRGYIEEHLLRR